MKNYRIIPDPFCGPNCIAISDDAWKLCKEGKPWQHRSDYLIAPRKECELFIQQQSGVQEITSGGNPSQ